MPYLVFNWLNTIWGDAISSSSTNFITDFIGYNNLALVTLMLFQTIVLIWQVVQQKED